MITLCIIAYVIFSLVKANQIYWEISYYDSYGIYKGANTNKRYMKTKESLIYGFLYIPKNVATVCLVIIVVYGVVKLLAWIITYLP